MGCTNTKPEGGYDAPEELPHTFKDRYTLGDVLGEGAFAVVKLAVHKRTKQKVAVKIVNRVGLSEVDELSLKQVMISIQNCCCVTSIIFIRKLQF